MPKGTKRTRSPGASKAKKAKVVDPVVEKVELITEAINTHHDDANIQDLLVMAAKSAFTEPKDLRHAFHGNFIDMIDSTLQNFIGDYQGKVSDSQAKVADADNVKETNIQTRDQLAEALEKKAEEIVNKEAELSEKTATTKALQKELKAKKTEMAKVCATMQSLEVDLEEATEKQTIFIGLRDEAAEKSEKDRKKHVTLILPFLKKMKVESSLVVSAPLALQKETRGTFDNAVVTEISTQFDSHIQTLKEGIATERTQNQEFIDDVERSEQNFNQAQAAQNQAQEELDTLESQKKELEDNKKQVDKDLKNHEKNVKKITDELSSFQETYEHLGKVYDAMVELRDRSTEKEEEPAEEEMEVALD